MAIVGQADRELIIIGADGESGDLFVGERRVGNVKGALVGVAGNVRREPKHQVGSAIGGHEHLAVV